MAGIKYDKLIFDAMLVISVILSLSGRIVIMQKSKGAKTGETFFSFALSQTLLFSSASQAYSPLPQSSFDALKLPNMVPHPIFCWLHFSILCSNYGFLGVHWYLCGYSQLKMLKSTA